MQIGRASKRTGASPDAIRFYERSGLLPRMPRTNGGFRLYSEQDVATLLFIRRGQRLGFSLAEIRELVSLRTRRHKPCEKVRDVLGRKLVHVREKIRELRELERELGASLRVCNRELRRRAAVCPILEIQTPPQRKQNS
jgi:DNA-binding transcriptional MerR regulator